MKVYLADPDSGTATLEPIGGLRLLHTKGLA